MPVLICGSQFKIQAQGPNHLLTSLIEQELRSGPKKVPSYTINDLDIMFFSKNDYSLYQWTYFDVKRLSKP